MGCWVPWALQWGLLFTIIFSMGPIAIIGMQVKFAPGACSCMHALVGVCSCMRLSVADTGWLFLVFWVTGVGGWREGGNVVVLSAERFDAATRARARG